jgi:hypothetical protein
MRRHSALMAKGIELAHFDPTDHERCAFQEKVRETFFDAQAAWGVYREHLIEHGILPSAQSSH